MDRQAFRIRVTSRRAWRIRGTEPTSTQNTAHVNSSENKEATPVTTVYTASQPDPESIDGDEDNNKDFGDESTTTETAHVDGSENHVATPRWRLGTLRVLPSMVTGTAWQERGQSRRAHRMPLMAIAPSTS